MMWFIQFDVMWFIQKYVSSSIGVIEYLFELFEGQIDNLIICLEIYIISKLPKSFLRSVYSLITMSPVSPTTPLTSTNLIFLSSSISILPGTSIISCSFTEIIKGLHSQFMQFYCYHWLSWDIIYVLKSLGYNIS